MPRFVIQQHHATSLHWDFRLEVGGAYKSWAVPKGPSMRPSDKRLAMAVEDHSIAWGDFEGTIGEGEYGAGPVIVWDRGTYENLRDEPMEEALAAGHASFWLEGEKLAGGWSLRRTDGRRWLLVKRRDEHADAGDPVSDAPRIRRVRGQRSRVSGYVCHPAESRRAPSAPGNTRRSRQSEKRQGRSEGRAEEIAARTVNKERARSGESSTRSRSSTQDISSSRRGGQRSGTAAPRAARATSSTTRLSSSTSRVARA